MDDLTSPSDYHYLIAPQLNANVLTIHNAEGKEILKLEPNGRLTLDPVNVDEAVDLFVKSVASVYSYRSYTDVRFSEAGKTTRDGYVASLQPEQEEVSVDTTGYPSSVGWYKIHEHTPLDEEGRSWLADQIRRLPTRVHPSRTMAMGWLSDQAVLEFVLGHDHQIKLEKENTELKRQLSEINSSKKSLSVCQETYGVWILDTQTGVRKLVTGFPGPWDGSSDYLWTDGNYSCDCNRSLFFGDSDITCGEDRFRVIKAVLPNGVEVEIEGEPDSCASSAT